MSKLHWMPILVKDIRGSNTYRRMSKSERGCYHDMLYSAWCNAYSNASCTLPANLDALYRETDCYSEQDRKDTINVLKAAWVVDDSDPSRYYNPKQREVFEEQLKKHTRRKKAADKRWNNASSNANALHDAMHMQCASDSDSDSDSDSKCNKKKESHFVDVNEMAAPPTTAKKSPCPVWPGCTHFRMDASSYLLAQEWYQKNNLPLNLLQPVALAVDVWLSGDTPKAKLARKRKESHHMRLYDAAFIEKGRKLLAQTNGRETAHDRNMQKLQQAEAAERAKQLGGLL